MSGSVRNRFTNDGAGHATTGTGLFANGFGLCGTTYSQWTAEMEVCWVTTGGPAWSASMAQFEVFLTGGPYGER